MADIYNFIRIQQQFQNLVPKFNIPNELIKINSICANLNTIHANYANIVNLVQPPIITLPSGIIELMTTIQEIQNKFNLNSYSVCNTTTDLSSKPSDLHSSVCEYSDYLEESLIEFDIDSLPENDSSELDFAQIKNDISQMKVEISDLKNYICNPDPIDKEFDWNNLIQTILTIVSILLTIYTILPKNNIHAFEVETIKFLDTITNNTDNL